MSINRYNYEEYFLLYTDNELTAAERQAVEEFVHSNRDLEEEFQLLNQAILVPDKNIIFKNKELLTQPGYDESFIHANNHEEIFILYADDELNPVEKAGVEQFIRDNPQFRESFELIQSIRLAPDSTITFPHKETLYRREKKPAIFAWWRMAAAAVVLLFTGIIWLNNSSPLKPSGKIVKLENKKPDKKGMSIPGSDGRKLESTKQKMRGADTKGISQVEKNDFPRTRIHLPAKQGEPIVEIMKPLAPIDPHAANVIQPEPMSRTIASTRINESERKDPTFINHTLNNTASPNNYATEILAASPVKNENVILANIPVDGKNSLRGLFRKASRLIDKTTSFRSAKRSGFNIGKVEIAFQ